MLEIQKLGPFKEMTPTLDYIHIENKFGPHGEGAVQQQMQVANTLSDDRRILWVALAMTVNLTSASDNKKTLLESEIRAHVGYIFEQPLDKSILKDQDIINLFATPLYHRVSEMLLSNLRAMGFDVSLPLAKPPREIVRKVIP